MGNIERYGVNEAEVARDEFDVIAEEIKLAGFSTLDSGLSSQQLDDLSIAFDRAADEYLAAAKGDGFDLDALGERDTIRALPTIAPEFWQLVFNERLATLLERLLGDFYILNQANGLNNRANKKKYSQSSYHRDLPYQHFVSTRPIAINALFAIDDFTLENGATRIIPSSHHRERFPSEELVARLERQIPVPRGTFIVLDCMAYHAGSENRSAADRRAVNHVFTIPMMRQQLHMRSLLDGDEDRFDNRQKKILGFGLEEFRSTNDWFKARELKS